MTKLTRAGQKIFGETAGATEIEQIGSLRNGAINYTTNPVTLQALAQYSAGLAAIVSSDKYIPALEDVNGIYYLFSRQIAYTMQEGVAEYDATTTYFTNGIVKDTASRNLYYSKSNNNLNNALSDTTKWGLYIKADEITYSTGLVTIVNALTVGGTITGNVIGNLTGTILTASQPNITEIGTLAGINLSSATSGITTKIAMFNTDNGTGSGIQISARVSDQTAYLKFIRTAVDYGLDFEVWLPEPVAGVSTKRLGITEAGVASLVGSLAVSGGFGCNGKSAQTAYASGGAVTDAGMAHSNAGGAAYLFTDQESHDALITLVNNMRTALVNAGIMS